MLLHQGPNRKYAQTPIPASIMNTIVDLKMQPQGRQLQHKTNHAIDARSAAPTKNMGYLSQSGMLELPSAKTTVKRACSTISDRTRPFISNVSVVFVPKNSFGSVTFSVYGTNDELTIPFV